MNEKWLKNDSEKQVISKLKNFLPLWFKRPFRQVIKFVRYTWRFYVLKSAVQRGRSLKIIVGAAETSQSGWYATNEQWLDITDAEHWNRLLRGQRLLTHVVSEHVFEHLTHDEADRALQLIALHLRPGGRVRIAVPDGYHPDPDYRRHVEICGIGADAADHKQLLNAKTLAALLVNNGFKPDLIEGYREEGDLVCKVWRPEDGFIQRSRQNKSVRSQEIWGFIDADTSLIVDGEYR